MSHIKIACLSGGGRVWLDWTVFIKLKLSYYEKFS